MVLEQKNPDIISIGVEKIESKNVVYYKNYLNGLEDFLHKESRTLSTLQYYNIMTEIQKIKEHITKIK